MVNTVKDFGTETTDYLCRARVMVAFCTSTYGEFTTGTYETYAELKYAYEHPQEIGLVPVKLIKHWPPKPDGPEQGRHMCAVAFGPSRFFVDGLDHEGCYLAPDVVARKIVKHIHRLGVLDQVKMKLGCCSGIDRNVLQSAESMICMPYFTLWP